MFYTWNPITLIKCEKPELKIPVGNIINPKIYFPQLGQTVNKMIFKLRFTKLTLDIETDAKQFTPIDSKNKQKAKTADTLKVI